MLGSNMKFCPQCGQPRAAQPAAQPAVQPEPQPEPQPAVQPAAQPAEKPAAQPEEKPAAQSAAQLEEKPAPQPAEKPAAQSEPQPAVQPAEKPAAQFGGKIDWRLANFTIWEYGQPRIKSKNALLLQWGCFFSLFLFGLMSVIFFFIPSFSYSVDGIRLESYSAAGIIGAFGLRGGISDLSVFSEQKGMLEVIAFLYGIIFAMGTMTLISVIFSVGVYSRMQRKSLVISATMCMIFSLLGMVLYIWAQTLIYKDLGMKLGSFGAAPYIYFALSLVLFACAVVLKCVKNEDPHAYLTLWDTFGVCKVLQKVRMPIVLCYAVVVTVVMLVMAFCYPMFSDGVFRMTLTQYYEYVRLIGSLGKIQPEEVVCIVAFVFLALSAALFLAGNVFSSLVKVETLVPGQPLQGKMHAAYLLLISAVVLYEIAHVAVFFMVMFKHEEGYNSMPFLEAIWIEVSIIFFLAAINNLTGQRLNPEEVIGSRRRRGRYKM